MPRKSDTPTNPGRAPRNRVNQAESGAVSLADDRREQTLGDEIMDVVQAALFLKVSPATVRTALAAGKLPGKRIGKEWRLSRTALIGWLSGPGQPKTYPRRPTEPEG